MGLKIVNLLNWSISCIHPCAWEEPIFISTSTFTCFYLKCLKKWNASCHSHLFLPLTETASKTRQPPLQTATRRGEKLQQQEQKEEEEQLFPMQVCGSIPIRVHEEPQEGRHQDENAKNRLLGQDLRLLRSRHHGGNLGQRGQIGLRRWSQRSRPRL